MKRRAATPSLFDDAGMSKFETPDSAPTMANITTLDAAPLMSKSANRAGTPRPLIVECPIRARTTGKFVRTPAQNGRRSRRKGKAWEREVAAMLRPVFGEHVARGFQSRSGRDGCDVEGTPYWLEAKHGRCVNLRAALRQAQEATDGRPCVVVARDNRTAPVVLMTLADWLAMMGSST